MPSLEGQLIGKEDKEAYRWMLRGTHQSEFFGVRPRRGASSHFVKGRTRVELSGEREDAEEIPPGTTQNPSLLSGKQRTPGTPARLERGERRAVRPRRGVLY